MSRYTTSQCCARARSVTLHLEFCQIQILVPVQLLVYHVPAHRVLDDVVVVGNFRSAHGSLEIAILPVMPGRSQVRKTTLWD